MPYTKQTWTNSDPVYGKLNKTRLDYIENGIYAAGLGIFNVKDSAYGATGNGTTDDTTAILAATTACGTAGGGTVYLPPGTYKVTARAIPGFAGYSGCIQLPPNCELRGAGAATIIKLANSNADTNLRIIGNTGLGGGDENISISNLIIDGNGVNQTVYSSGIAFLRARNITLTNVTFKNLFGDAANPPGETFHFSTDQCVDVTYLACTALGDSGTQGTGFGDNSSTNVRYIGCTARGMSAGMGFASWHGRNVTHTACRAYKNGTNGFNAELGFDITYDNCIAGGKASDQAAGYFYANNAELGNTGTGFVINATTGAIMNGCISSRNNAHGLSVVNAGAINGGVQVIGGQLNDNGVGGTGVGAFFNNVASARLSNISVQTQVTGNATNNLNLLGGIGYCAFTYDGFFPAPAIPAHATAIYNDFPCDVLIYITHVNSYFVTLTGTAINTSPVVRVKSGGTISINYGTVPSSWYWQRA